MTNVENIGAPAAKAVKKKASGSSFYIAMRLMPAEERDAMFAIYAFCRKVDDIADDGVGTRAERHERLEQWRDDLRALYAGTASAQVRFLAPAVQRYGLRLQDFLSILDGMDMDVAEDIVAPSLDVLDLYCDRVASAVGRLSVRAFGATEPQADEVAYHLGRALQLTNILRDLGEDAERGRLYLPRELLDGCGITDRTPMKVVTHAKLPEACQALARRARQHFAGAHVAMAACAKAPMRPAAIMGGVYRAILERLIVADWRDPFARISLPKWQKLWLAFRYGFL